MAYGEIKPILKLKWFIEKPFNSKELKKNQFEQFLLKRILNRCSIANLTMDLRQNKNKNIGAMCNRLTLRTAYCLCQI